VHGLFEFRHVNIVDLVNLRRTGKDDIQVFATLEDLRVYTKEPGPFFPKDFPAAGALLKPFFREIFGHRMMLGSCQFRYHQIVISLKIPKREYELVCLREADVT
jgi:hypothetical protein